MMARMLHCDQLSIWISGEPRGFLSEAEYCFLYVQQMQMLHKGCRSDRKYS